MHPSPHAARVTCPKNTRKAAEKVFLHRFACRLHAVLPAVHAVKTRSQLYGSGVFANYRYEAVPGRIHGQYGTKITRELRRDVCRAQFDMKNNLEDATTQNVFAVRPVRTPIARRCTAYCLDQCISHINTRPATTKDETIAQAHEGYDSRF